MHRKLILAAFKKAGEDTGSGFPKRLASHLSDFILDKSGESFGEKSLRNYYNASLKDENRIIELRPFVVKSLCSYLEYADFQDFNKANPAGEATKTKGSESPGLHKKAIIALIAVVSAAIGGYAISEFTQPRLMVWKGDHYEEVSLDLNKYKLSELKVYSQERIDNFRKVNPDCSYAFFDPEGRELLWYARNESGELECFTALAKHPETGATLKKITPYMIKKYLCESYGD